MGTLTYLVPPEWELIDPAEPERRIPAVVSGLLGERTAEQREVAAPVLVEHLTAAMRGLGEAGAVAVLLGAYPMLTGMSVPSVVIRPLETPNGQAPIDYLVGLAAQDASAQLLEIDHAVGLRTHQVEPVASTPAEVPEEWTHLMTYEVRASVAEASDRVAHRVRYVVGLPSLEDSWVELLASVQVPRGEWGEDMGATCLAMFDRIASGLTWTGGR